MAQLKDLIVTGPTRLIGEAYGRISSANTVPVVNSDANLQFGTSSTIATIGGVAVTAKLPAGGYQGPKGTDGTNGKQGPQGPKGTDGTNGTNGTDGKQGPQGPKGSNGTDGKQGPQGPKGTDGTNGKQGPQGPKGTDATGLQGPQGPKGSNGTNGTDGKQGPQGPKGPNGTDGKQGPQGPKGTDATGFQGPQGPKGGTGGTGSRGYQGYQGPQGPKGTDATGLQGPQGPKGSNGTNGTDGKQGPQGPKGSNGTNGTDGKQGPQGPKGSTTKMYGSILTQLDNLTNQQWTGTTGSNSGVGQTMIFNNSAIALAYGEGDYLLAYGSDTEGNGHLSVCNITGKTSPNIYTEVRATIVAPKGAQGPAGSGGGSGTGTQGPQGPKGSNATGKQGPQGPNGAQGPAASGDYLPITGGTLTGNLRLKDSTNYGKKINFGDNDYVYIAELSDDQLVLHGNSTVTIEVGDGGFGMDGIIFKDTDSDTSVSVYDLLNTGGGGSSISAKGSTGATACYLLGINSTTATGTGVELTSTNVFRAGNATGSGVYFKSLQLYASSDERLKDFIGDVEVDFNDIAKIPKKYFTLKDSDEKTVQIGTSAQKLREIYPELVSGDEDKEMLAVAYDRLGVVALAAVDKLHEENMLLKKEIEELKERLNRIEGMNMPLG